MKVTCASERGRRPQVVESAVGDKELIRWEQTSEVVGDREDEGDHDDQ